MKDISKERAQWLSSHILPYEHFLRARLSSKPRGTLEVDDIIQQTYLILASLESVEEIRDPKSYAGRAPPFRGMG